MQDPQILAELQQLEGQLRQEIALQRASLTPDPSEVAAIEQELPQAWQQDLHMLELEQEIEEKVLEPLYGKSLSELNEGVRQVVEELDIDVEALMQEVEEPDISIEMHIDHDDHDR